MEECRAGAAQRLGDLDGHDAEIEELIDELVWYFRLFIHVAHERPQFAIGELVHAAAKQRFVVAERRQGRRCGELLLHRAILRLKAQSPKPKAQAQAEARSRGPEPGA